MRYNEYDIIKNEDESFTILDRFKVDITKHTYKSRKEAKAVIDNVLSKRANNTRYMAVHASRYWWSIIDKTTNKYVIDEVTNKPLNFKRREEAFSWCEINNKRP